MSTITNARDRPGDPEIQEIKQKIKKAINSNEKLLSFLKENKIYGRYIKNTVNCLIQDTTADYITRCIKQDFNPINCAFTWSRTSEGHEFWKKYDSIYRLTIKNKEKY